jgi:hypothetical protein
VLFFSWNSKKMRKLNIDNLKLFNLDKFFNSSKNHIIRLEPNLFWHIFFNNMIFPDIVRITDLWINDERYDLFEDNFCSNAQVFIFDKYFWFILNVYSWEWLDISSYDKEFLYKLRDEFKNDFKVLDDKIDI